MTGSTPAALPRPLPIRARPRPAESVESYIRRLAQANHLRPSLLHAYLRDPANPARSIRPERLAAASGRTLAALTHTLTGLGPRPAPSIGPPQQTGARVAAARKAELFATIRRDADRGLSIRALASRHHVHRRTIRQALNAPTPPPRKQPTQRKAPVLDPIRQTIDALIGENLTAWQIWERLLDKHEADASYSTVRDYLARQRRTDRSRTRANRPD